MAHIQYEKCKNEHGIPGWRYILVISGCADLMVSRPNWYGLKKDARQAVKAIIKDIAQFGLEELT